jgi:ribosomal protein S18 acetylase RimI-like enzyme
MPALSTQRFEERAVISANIDIRRVMPADAALYRVVRLEGLEHHPEAFGASFETERAQPDSFFAERLAGSEVLGAFASDELLGIVGLRVLPGLKEAHKGQLWGMYVRPQARQAGVGRRLVDTLLKAARPRVELVQLSVWQANAAARRLYESFGFIEYGLELKALKHNGTYYNLVLMAKPFGDSAG